MRYPTISIVLQLSINDDSKTILAPRQIVDSSTARIQIFIMIGLVLLLWKRTNIILQEAESEDVQGAIKIQQGTTFF